jgi:LEA14-like dessication related protein
MTRPLAIASLLLLTGCFEEIEPFLPTVQFGRLDVQALDWEHIETDFVFYVDNPNPVGIPLESFDYALSLADIELLSGADPDGLELLASDMSEVALPVDLAFLNVYDVVQTTRGLDAVPFGLEGSFGFDSPLGVVNLPYDAGGDFPALRTPSLDLGRLRLDDLSLTGATLELDINVDNDHGSTVWLENFDYALSLEGVRVGEGFIQDFAGIDGATTYTVGLPLEVDFLSAGEALYNAFTGGDPINVKIEAGTDVITPFEGFTLPLDISESGRLTLQ